MSEQSPPNIFVKIDDTLYQLAPGNKKFWLRVADNQWEADTFSFLDRCLKPDSIYLDVGAWIGPTVLFAAKRCHKVYCIEPDAVAYEKLLANLRMNEVHNVLPFHGALHSENCPVQITNSDHFGNSETRVQTSAEGGITVVGIKISVFIDWWKIDRIDLLKMDIEGAEFDLIPSLIHFLDRYKPAVHLSLHAPLFAESERLEKLERIVKFASCYTYCFDKNMRKIDPKDILSERFQKKFTSVILTDVPL